MSARHCLPTALLFAAGLLPADEAGEPDTEFLEYLGMWDGQDDGWVLFVEAPPLAGDEMEDERTDPEPDGDASAETDDEG